MPKVIRTGIFLGISGGGFVVSITTTLVPETYKIFAALPLPIQIILCSSYLIGCAAAGIEIAAHASTRNSFFCPRPEPVIDSPALNL
jgi:hypothetical protein